MRAISGHITTLDHVLRIQLINQGFFGIEELSREVGISNSATTRNLRENPEFLRSIVHNGKWLMGENDVFECLARFVRKVRGKLKNFNPAEHARYLVSLPILACRPFIYVPNRSEGTVFHRFQATERRREDWKE